MIPLVIEKRFCGPPGSANGGYACGLVAGYIDGDAEITLLAPPPLGQRLNILVDGRGVELKKRQTTLAIGRRIHIDIPEIPIVNFSDARDAVRRSPHDKIRHPFPMCFVCGPARSDGDGLRITPNPLPPHLGNRIGTVAAPWVPSADLADEDGAIAREFVWAALDCPAGFAAAAAHHLGVTGTETILLGRMSARLQRRPRPGDPCTIVAWPIGRDRRKLFASSALLSSDGEVLAVAHATWLLIDRQVQLSE